MWEENSWALCQTTIASWTDEKLILELRNPIRIQFGAEAYILPVAEALARILRRSADIENGVS